MIYPNKILYSYALYVITLAFSLLIFDGYSQIKKPKSKKKVQKLEMKPTVTKQNSLKNSPSDLKKNIKVGKGAKSDTNKLELTKIKKKKKVLPDQLNPPKKVIAKRTYKRNLEIKGEHKYRYYPKRLTVGFGRYVAKNTVNYKRKSAELQSFNPKMVTKKRILLWYYRQHSSYKHYQAMKYKSSYKRNERYRNRNNNPNKDHRKINMPLYLRERNKAKPKYDKKEALIWYE